MAQARITAKNTFGSGLIMDFAPDNTLADVLTNALNATLLTFNGNEMSLQNDMGNCRVESAYLPEGYVPVGTCEFGDIIYIVSYNPLENKSLIGCFPSPERNISNKEISNLTLSIIPSEFLDYSPNDVNNPTGKINSSSIKKIIFGNTNINSGDKFIISWGEAGESNLDKISNYGNTSHSIKASELYWPKITLIHVISIEDSGKITYLDDSVHWYEGNDDNSNPTDFIISSEVLNNSSTVSNLDQYRHALQCQYSVFQSRVSGKLALLLELETINNFSCGHKTIRRIDESTGDELFDIYFSAFWETDNYNINPCGMLVTDSEFIHMQSVNSSEETLNVRRAISNNHLYSPSRVIDFTRLYKLEDPSENYKTFINLDSYYTLVKDYLTIYNQQLDGDLAEYKAVLGSQLLAGESKEEYSDSKTVLRLYNIVNGGRIPATEDPNDKNSNSLYVINPALTSYDENSQLIYKTIVSEREVTCSQLTIPDDVVVNSFKKSVLKYIATVRRTRFSSTEDEKTALQDDQNSYKITYTVCPCMPYGPLTHLAVTNTIDFNREATGDVNLSTWKYYVNSSSITLNFGFDTYLKEDENEVVDKVLIEFYDNLGICATYELNNLESYDAKFTEYIELDLTSTNFRMTGYLLPLTGSLSRELTDKIFHKYSDTPDTFGNIKDSDSRDLYMYYNNGAWHAIPALGDELPTTINDLTSVYKNDAGVLYYGRPYIAKIKIYKGTLNELGEVDPSGYTTPIEENRWLWTAPIFNDFYGTTPDFKDCLFTCNLDFTASFDGRKLEDQKKSAAYASLTLGDSEDFSSYKSLGASVDYINIDRKNNSNIIFSGTPGLSDSFGNSIFLDTGAFNKINVALGIDNCRIETSTDTYTTEYEDTFIGEKAELYPLISNYSGKTIDDIINENYGDSLLTILGYTRKGSSVTDEIYSSSSSYSKYLDLFSLDLNISSYTSKNSETVLYLDGNGSSVSSTITLYKIPANYWSSSSGKTPELNLRGIKFNKRIAGGTTKKSLSKLLRPILSTENDLTYYGMGIGSDKIPYFTRILGLACGENGGQEGWRQYTEVFYTSGTDGTNTAGRFYEEQDGDDVVFNLDDDGIQQRFFSNFLDYPIQEVVICYGSEKGDNLNELKIPGTNCEKLTSIMGPQNVNGDILTSGQTPKLSLNNPGNSAFESKKNIYNMVTTLAYVSNNKFYVGADFALHSILYTKMPQKFDWKPGVGSKYPSYTPVTNYAELISSLFMQLYVVDNVSSTITLYENIAKLLSYSEYWKANIIVKETMNSYQTTTLDSDASSEYIKILPKDFVINGTTYNGITLRAYVLSVLEKAELSAFDLNNINPEIKDIIKCVEFNYELPYDTSKINALYESDSSSGARILVQVSEDGSILTTPIYKTIVAPSDDSKIYIYGGGDLVSEFRGGKNFKLIKNFTTNGGYVYGKESDITIDLNTKSKLADALKYDGLYIYIDDITNFRGGTSTYRFFYDCDYDDPSITNARKINIFNYGKIF